jgi:histidinol phosphatase-like PHP family hydrolase
LELATIRNGKDSYSLPDKEDLSLFDFCLIEHIDHPQSVAKEDFFGYAKRFKCPVGVAHTDLFTYCKNRGEDPHRFLRKMAENNIFWEMNVNLDSVHNFKTHAYVTEFFKNKEQQEIVKKSGVKLSVGFDCHAAKEYKADRIKTANKLIKDMGIRLAFDGI